jgi:hypothetical protein
MGENGREQAGAVGEARSPGAARSDFGIDWLFRN